MSDSLQVRSAVAADAVVVARIGREGVATQYIGLVDAAAIEAAVQQTYSVNAIAACIERCSGAEPRSFSSPSETAWWKDSFTSMHSDPSQSFTASTSTAARVVTGRVTC